MAFKAQRGEIWAVDFDPQTHKEEPGKRNRPALVIQTDILNKAGHPTTIVIPGTSDVVPEDCFPLRISLGRLHGQGAKEATDLLIDQMRAISNARFMGRKPIATLSITHMKRVDEAIGLLLGIRL